MLLATFLQRSTVRACWERRGERILGVGRGLKKCINTPSLRIPQRVLSCSMHLSSSYISRDDVVTTKNNYYAETPAPLSFPAAPLFLLDLSNLPQFWAPPQFPLPRFLVTWFPLFHHELSLALPQPPSPYQFNYYLFIPTAQSSSYCSGWNCTTCFSRPRVLVVFLVPTATPLVPPSALVPTTTAVPTAWCPVLLWFLLF